MRKSAEIILKRGKRDSNGCLIWDGCLDKDGYPKSSYREDGKLEYRVIRVLVKRLGFKLQSNEVVRHTCNNPACIEPSHLSIGTQFENIQDKVKASRQARGDTHPRAFLSEKQVLEIRSLASRIRLCQLAKMFNVNSGTIWLIIHRRTWKHI